MNGHAAQCFGVDASLSSGSSPLAVAKPEPPPPPKDWKIDKLPEIGNSGQDIVQTAAILEGQSTVGGKTGGAYLVMHCGFPTPYYPDLLPLETILAGTDEMFTAPGAPGMFVDISDFASSQIGTATCNSRQRECAEPKQWGSCALLLRRTGYGADRKCNRSNLKTDGQLEFISRNGIERCV